jgi:hypothetical protein
MKKWMARQNKVTQNIIQFTLMMLAFGLATIAVGLLLKGGK